MHLKKIRLEIIGIFSAPSEDAHFTLLLGEVEGYRKMPIMIGTLEAQSIALGLEGGTLERPNMHDLYKSTLLQMGYAIVHAVITDLKEEVFFAELLLSNGKEQIVIDSRPSDAIALAVRFSVPIYINDQVLSQVSDVIITEMDLVKERSLPMVGDKKDENDGTPLQLEQYAIKTLEKLLVLAVACEDYERAACIRDELKRREA
eukprot:gene206-271_t